MADNFILLDGGMGRELERMGAPFKQPEWSALALMQSPESVKQAHRNYINAGANIITTNAYALVPFHIGQACFDERAFELADLAGQLAQDVANEYATTHRVQVAGCIPPLFGSYRPGAFQQSRASNIIQPIIAGQQAYVDLWLIETVSSTEEGQAILNLLPNDNEKPVWLSFTLTNREPHEQHQPICLRSGELLTDILPLLDKCDAVLFNCSQPEEMQEAIEFVVKHRPGLSVGAYANSFSEPKRTHEANEMLTPVREDLPPPEYAAFAQNWIKAGASIIGGCCGIGPEHIEVLARIKP